MASCSTRSTRSCHGRGVQRRRLFSSSSFDFSASSLCPASPSFPSAVSRAVGEHQTTAGCHSTSSCFRNKHREGAQASVPVFRAHKMRRLRKWFRPQVATSAFLFWGCRQRDLFESSDDPTRRNRGSSPARTAREAAAARPVRRVLPRIHSRGESAPDGRECQRHGHRA